MNYSLIFKSVLIVSILFAIFCSNPTSTKEEITAFDPKAYSGVWHGKNCFGKQFEFTIDSTGNMSTFSTTLKIDMGSDYCIAPFAALANQSFEITKDFKLQIGFQNSDIVTNVSFNFQNSDSCHGTIAAYGNTNYSIICGSKYVIGFYGGDIIDTCLWAANKD